MANNKKALDGAYRQLKRVFDSSEQSIYIYADDINKVCNKKFASLLGYKSPEEWAKVDENFPSAFVADKSQHDLISAYQNAMEKMTASKLKVAWKTKSGKNVVTSVILVPIIYEGNAMALHFVSKA